MTAHRVVVDGVALVVDEHGPADGPPVVVLHGFSGGAEAVAELTAPLVLLGRRVIVPDLVGHGRSDVPDDVAHYSMAACVRQLEGVCESLGAGPVTLMGYSMGGRVALSWLASRPAWVEAMLTIGASAGMADADDRRARRRSDEQLADRIEQEGIDWFAPYWAERPIFATQAARLTPEQHRRLDRLRRSQHPVGLANSLRGMGTGAMPFIPPSRLAGCSSRACLVAGGDDAKFCRIGEELATVLAAAQFVSIAGAGHAAHLEQPRTMGRVIAGFLGPR